MIFLVKQYLWNENYEYDGPVSVNRKPTSRRGVQVSTALRNRAVAVSGKDCDASTSRFHFPLSRDRCVVKDQDHDDTMYNIRFRMLYVQVRAHLQVTDDGSTQWVPVSTWQERKSG